MLDVLHGVVWLTEEGGGGDMCLGAGTRYRVRRRGRVVVEALGDRVARLTVSMDARRILEVAEQREHPSHRDEQEHGDRTGEAR